MGALIALVHDAGVPIEIVLPVLAAVVDQQVVFFRYKIQDIDLAEGEVGRQLQGKGGAGFLAKAAENTAGEVDAKPGRITPAVFPFRRFHGDAADGTDRRTEVAGHAAFVAVRVARENDPAP